MVRASFFTKKDTFEQRPEEGEEPTRKIPEGKMYQTERI